MAELPAHQVLAGALAAASRGVRVARGAQDVDWDAFLALVARHQVGPLVHASGWTDAHGAPGWVAQALARHAQLAVGATLRWAALQRELVDVLTGAGIAVLVLKGPSIAHDAYDGIASRHVGDLDLLVAPGDVAEAMTLLERSGFEWADRRLARGELPRDPRRLPLVHAVGFARAGAHVDLHWRVTENPRLMPLDPHWLAAPRRVELAGATTPVLPVDALWRYLLVHGARHRWRRLKWVVDVPMLARRHPALVSSRGLRAVADEGLARCVATGLRVAERVLGNFLDPAARAWAEAVRGTDVLVYDSLAALRSERWEIDGLAPREAFRFVAGQLSLRPDAAYRREEVKRLLLLAGHAYPATDAGLGLLIGGPPRWVMRWARRTAA